MTGAALAVFLVNTIGTLGLGSIQRPVRARRVTGPPRTGCRQNLAPLRRV
jgi:hypothetical protein